MKCPELLERLSQAGLEPKMAYFGEYYPQFGDFTGGDYRFHILLTEGEYHLGSVAKGQYHFYAAFLSEDAVCDEIWALAQVDLKPAVEITRSEAQVRDQQARVAEAIKRLS